MSLRVDKATELIYKRNTTYAVTLAIKSNTHGSTVPCANSRNVNAVNESSATTTDKIMKKKTSADATMDVAVSTWVCIGVLVSSKAIIICELFVMVIVA